MGKTYIADKETLDKCYAILSADGIYGFIEHIRNTVGKEDGEVKGSKPWILSQTHRSHAVVHGMVYLHGHIRLLPEQDKTLYPCGPA